MRIGFPASYNVPPAPLFASESLNTWASKRDRFSVPRRVWEAGIRQQSRENYIQMLEKFVWNRRWKVKQMFCFAVTCLNG